MSAATPGWTDHYLKVNGEPFIVLGAEVHNSSSSTVRAISESFATVAALGANTVLAPVAWNLFEPEEGRYDATLVRAMIAEAAARDLRLIPLWFGSWKNAASTYVPDWVRRDSTRFPRSRRADGTPLEHLTPFAEANRDADARAFSALLRCIAHDDRDGRVIAVQVQNEIGLLGDSRDRSEEAVRAWQAPVPTAIVAAVASDTEMPIHAEWQRHGARAEGSWSEVFPEGDRADEAFMASGFATYTQAVAAAGRTVMDVPLFVNAWLDADSVLDGPVAVSGGKRPGEYPSGGPIVAVAAIWEALAPDLDFLAPDMYVDDAEPIFGAYASRRGRLFIPELRADDIGIAQMFRAFGTHRAVGVSPFGVDALDPAEGVGAALADAYELLGAASVVIGQHPDARVESFVLSESAPGARIVVGDVNVEVHSRDEWGFVVPRYPAYGVAVVTRAGELFLAGRGFWITLSVAGEGTAGLLEASLLVREGERLEAVLHINGDETASGTLIPFPFLGGGLLPGRQIPTRVPDQGIARIVPYVF